LGLDGILGGPVKRFDTKVLLDPFEKDLDLPATLKQLGNGQCWQGNVVGQEDEVFVLIGVEIANTSQFFGIGFVGIETFEDNDLVGLNPCGFVDGSRIKTPESEIAFRSGHKKCQGLVDYIKASKIEIASIDDVKGARFEDKLIHDGDIVNFPMGNNDNGRNASTQVQERV